MLQRAVPVVYEASVKEKRKRKKTFDGNGST
jgi:hypothetical protein